MRRKQNKNTYHKDAGQQQGELEEDLQRAEEG
jgi:hypothetical protein